MIEKNCDKKEKIKKIRSIHQKYSTSIVNEGIRVILNLFIFFFLQLDFTTCTKTTKRIQANKNKKDSIFMRIKNI